MTATDQPNPAKLAPSHNSWLEAARSELVGATPDVGGLRNLADKALTGDNLLYAGAAVVVAGGAALIATRFEPIAAFARGVSEMLGSRTAAAELPEVQAAFSRTAMSELAGSRPAALAAAGSQDFSLDAAPSPFLLRMTGASEGSVEDSYDVYRQLAAAGYMPPRLMTSVDDLVHGLTPIITRAGEVPASDLAPVLNQMRLAVNELHQAQGVADIVDVKQVYAAGASGAAGQGTISLNTTLLRPVFQFPTASSLPYARARLVGILGHEAVHIEQEDAVLRMLADGMKLGKDPLRTDLEALMLRHPKSSQIAGTDWWNLDFVANVMKARNGEPLAAPLARRAQMLNAAFFRGPVTPYYLKPTEAEAFELERVTTDRYLTLNHGADAVRRYTPPSAYPQESARRFLSG